MGALQAAYRPASKRMMNHDIPWVACQYPTAALAQEAGLSTEDFAELLYGSVLLDWAAEGERMRAISATSTRRRRSGSSARAPTCGSRSRGGR